MSKQLEAIAVLESYFGRDVIPQVAQTFTPGKGWQPFGTRKCISRAYAGALIGSADRAAKRHPAVRQGARDGGLG